jgi:hypothetical protein
MHLLVMFMCAGLSAGACAKSEKESHAEGKIEAVAAHAPANAKPGSHEDWCAEHEVPESQCTLCNATLAAAFKATGDWCEEHGLPESHCRKCNPNLKIVRPPKTN